jgi:hypothetical protein
MQEQWALMRPDHGVAVAVAVAVPVCVAVGVPVAGRVDVKVAVGACELWLVIRGVTQRAKSSCDDPFEKIVSMNLTFSPLNGLRSMLTE